jgi:hypothetical protein
MWVMNCIEGKTRRVVVPVIVFVFVSLSFLIWWPPALVGKHLSFVIEITEQTPRTTRIPTSCACVPHQRLEEDAARVRSPTQSAHALSHARRYPAWAISVASQQ